MSPSPTHRQILTRMLEEAAIRHDYHAVSGVLECDFNSYGSVTVWFSPDGTLRDIRFIPKSDGRNRSKFRPDPLPLPPKSQIPSPPPNRVAAAQSSARRASGKGRK